MLPMFARFVSIFFMMTALGFAQQKPDLAGDYAGLLGPLHVKLHLASGSDGTLTGTVDSPDQNMFSVPCADFHLNGQALSFTVPMVHGTWVGFVGGNGTSLSGMWNQGSPVPLNLTRVGTADNTAATTDSTHAGPPSARESTNPSSTTGSSEQPCPSAYGLSYFDGSGWKPMMLAVIMPKEQGESLKEGMKNPLNPMRGRTLITRYKDPAAPLTLEASPRFCVRIAPNYNPSNILIGRIDVKKDHRELETSPYKGFQEAADSWMPAKRVQAIDIKRISDTVVEVTPQKPLPPGQYILGGPPMIGMYDFGVQGNN